MNNYYHMLDLPPTATPEEIKRQYRQLVRVFHPDRFQNDSDREYATRKLKEINEAYRALAGDPDGVVDGPPPKPMATPNRVDFGIVAPGERVVRQVQVGNIGGEARSLAFTLGEEGAWYKIIQGRRVNSENPLPLQLHIEANTAGLAPEEAHAGWINVRMDGVTKRINLDIQVAKPARTSAIGARTVVGLALLAVIALSWWSVSAFGPLPEYGDEEIVSATSLRAPLDNRFILTIMQNGQQMLHAVDRDGGNLESLDIVASDPTFSNADRRLAYTAPVDGTTQIFVASAAAGEIEQVTTGREDKHSPQWSQDGQYLAYLVEDGLRTYVQLHRLSDGEQTSYGHDALNPMTSLAWSPDGASLLVDGEKDGMARVLILDLGSGRFHSLIDFETQDPAWSPDGKRIVVSSNRGLYTLDPDGRNMRRLNAQPAWSPTWSPDGTQIAFLSDHNSPAGRADLWTIDTAGGRAVALTQDGAGVVNAIWMPDASGIAFITTSQDAGSPPAQLWLLSPHGGAQFIREASSSHVAWLHSQ